MVSNKFRQQLRHEAEQWQADDLITATQYQQLAEMYQFDSLDTSARDRFIVVLLSLGSLLLGLGIITFVAANWQAIPRLVKVVLLMALFIGVNAGGFYLWKRVPNLPDGRERWQQRLGQGLLLLGGLVLGANIALMGQMFHRSGSPYELCLIWGLGVLAMAYSLRLISLGVLSIVLTGIGYWLGIQELSSVGVLPGLNLLMQYMPLLAGILFLPLSYWCRSRSLFMLTAIAVLSSFEVVLSDASRFFTDAPGVIIAIALALPPALLWSYDDHLWTQLVQPSVQPTNRLFQPLARGLALLYLTVLIYILSFHQIWEAQSDLMPLSAQLTHLFTVGWPFLFNPNVLVLIALTLLQWTVLIRSTYRGGRWRMDSTDRTILILIGLTALVPFWHWSIFPLQAIATIAFNIVLFLLAAGLMREGLAGGNRALFWSSMILLALQILSRLLEYETGLLLKSLAFVLCGAGIIVIGLWFERYVRTLDSTRPSLPSNSLEDS